MNHGIYPFIALCIPLRISWGYLVEQGPADFVVVEKGPLIDLEWAAKAPRNQEVKPCLDCKLWAYFVPDGVCLQSGAGE
jgi:hypothetical protein